MPAPVEISVRTQLVKIAKDLEGIQKQAQGFTKALVQAGKSIDEIAQEGTSQTEKKVSRTGAAMKRVLSGLAEDLKTAFSIQALAGSYRLGNQLVSTITQTVSLANKVQKLSGVYKMARGEQTRFVEDMTRGLGNLGLSSEVGERSLEGLAETPVRSRSALQNYAKTSGMLASAGGEQGKEGDISKLLAQVLIARGANPESPTELRKMAEAVDSARRSGAGPASKILGEMNQLYAGLSDDLKGRVSPQGAAQMATVGLAGGPGATSFFQRYLSTPWQQRSGMDALGVGKVFGKDGGFNFDAFKSLASTAKGFGGGSTAQGFQNAFGASEEEAKGLSMLSENLERVKRATDEAAASTKRLETSYDEAKTVGEAFRGNFDRLKGTFAAPIAGATAGLTGIFKETQKTDEGAALVAGGSVIAASVLAGLGMSGIGRALGIKSASEQLRDATGKKAQDVFVVNADEIRGPGMIDKLGAAAGLGGAGMAALGIAAAGTAAAIALNEKKQYEKTIEPIRQAEARSEEQTQILQEISQRLGEVKIVGETPGGNEFGPMPRSSRTDLKIEVIDGNGRIKATQPAGRGPVMGGQ
jgi:hypothetical protein